MEIRVPSPSIGQQIRLGRDVENVSVLPGLKEDRLGSNGECVALLDLVNAPSQILPLLGGEAWSIRSRTALRII
jgi:hypothetical protein